MAIIIDTSLLGSNNQTNFNNTRVTYIQEILYIQVLFQFKFSIFKFK